MRIYFRMAAIALILAGCDSRRIFEDNVEFQSRSWKISEPAQFEFQITDPAKKYNLFLNIRNSLDYPFARIFVNYELMQKDSSLNKKMISEYLFDQKTGKPFGTSGIGDIYDHQFPILNEYTFGKAGAYKIKLGQFMRMDTIPGILAIGIRVETTSK